MVNFLLKRPIAVTMTFIAILVLGIASTTRLPVSLMPDIDIPKITVQASYPNHSAAELESTVAKPLRQQLMQVSHLNDIRTESRDGSCVILLDFEYGIDIDYLFIEVNEKIDRAINNLPREISRPRVIKASATDIPVFYLNLTLKQAAHQSLHQASNSNEQNTKKELFPVSKDFIELSNFSNHVIKKRIEQLQEVAMVDISGLVFPELLVLPDLKKIEALNVKLADIEEAINNNNINLGNLLIRDGQYQYNIRFASTLKNKEDLESIYFKVDGRLLQLKDIAQIIEHPAERQGLVTSNRKEAITMAVIKQSDSQMRELKIKLNDLIEHFNRDYPHIDFEVTRNQTVLLEYSISNLGQSLFLGGMLAFVVMFFFLKDFKSPLLIGITIPTSLVISLLFFYVVGISVNIISLSGLILGVGMMIDNSIIVIDNITQHRERSNISTIEQLNASCANGTNEVFRPMLSSVLTTCAVFIPLIFIKGISGALFFDQAMAITIGLLVSLVVSVTLLPVYYRIFYLKNKPAKTNILTRINTINYGYLYEKGFRLVMKNQGWPWILFIIIIAGIYPLFTQLEKSKLPSIAKNEALIYIDWNERIHIDENKGRVESLVAKFDKLIQQHTCLIGDQQFLLSSNSGATASEVVIYIKTSSEQSLNSITTNITDYLNKRYPTSVHSISDAGNIFNLLFSENTAPLVARLRATKDLGRQKNASLQQMVHEIKDKLPDYHVESIPWEEHIVVKILPEKLTAFNITFDGVYRALISAFSENEVLMLAGNQQFTPVILGGKKRLLNEILDELTVPNTDGEQIRLNSLLKEGTDYGQKTIYAGRQGEYYPIKFEVKEGEAQGLIEKIRQTTNGNGNFEADFSGSIFSNRELLKELMIILIISLCLLYFILASQFESLTLPLIVLLEVPIDIFGAFLMLRLFGESLNLMSIIGIIVMCGIIINDSILKIDTINQLRQQGYSLLRALAVAGQRRLKPILMTSLTTILALLPFLFIQGIGADLQRPLALAVIGGMIIGTIVSLYFIPLLYYRLNKKNT
jgi:multidrug efflux pump subunit AcrB